MTSCQSRYLGTKSYYQSVTPWHTAIPDSEYECLFSALYLEISGGRILSYGIDVPLCAAKRSGIAIAALTFEGNIGKLGVIRPAPHQQNQIWRGCCFNNVPLVATGVAVDQQAKFQFKRILGRYWYIVRPYGLGNPDGSGVKLHDIVRWENLGEISMDWPGLQYWEQHVLLRI
ncbi:hypothetical protein BDP27DRAFT_1405467 [Rhodocollybia butyracea]|uniref:Uncharacterized protein n=1 Tax=Rhodocollybia butyracea TaxID=206335 RepID=A0A9P5U3Y2_9AGAR|nr:hypothetical protein BDP27DRAFT_1405467 [Rhodocollybia butyracea]